jgi:hypothetical protein
MRGVRRWACNRPANPDKIARDLAAIKFGESVTLPKALTMAKVVSAL